MGKNYDAYEKAAQAETDAKARWILEPNAENETNAKQAELNANLVFNEMLDNPER